MLKIIFFISLSLFISHPIHAAVHTDTHTYIVSPFEYKIVVVDRRTGYETILNIGEYISGIALYEGRGYVTAENAVLVYDLKTHTHQSTIKSEADLSSMSIYEGYGYGISLKSSSVCIIDLANQKIIKTIGIDHLKQIEFYGQNGYIISSNGKVSFLRLKTHTLTGFLHFNSPIASYCFFQGYGYFMFSESEYGHIINLEVRSNSNKIFVGKFPKPMIIHEGSGYIVSQNCITVIDLYKQRITRTIPIESVISAFTLYKTFAFVTTLTHKEILVVDMDSFNIVKQIPCSSIPRYIHIHQDFAYAESIYPSKIYILNLHTFDVTKQIEYNRLLAPLDFSDTHIYLGATKHSRLPTIGLVLFDRPYQGIEEPFTFEDGDEDFQLFEWAVLRQDNDAVVKNFKQALACGHKKANAVAFKAFLHGYWGANQDDFWAAEFGANADFNYLKRIQNNPHYLILSPCYEHAINIYTCCVQ